MTYQPNNSNQEDLESSNWDVIELSEVDDKIIKKLLHKLSVGISDDFFLSFESLMKIGEKSKNEIIGFIKKNNLDPFIKDILYYILNYMNKLENKLPLINRLYHPDFLIRARTIMELENTEDSKYLKYILPLIKDPDDSVRWAVIRYLISKELIRNPLVRNQIKNHLDDELNPTIKAKIQEVIN